ncbi:MAG: gluconokinase [Niabella sp.]|nr:gluconokinase [Niabella sp.]
MQGKTIIVMGVSGSGKSTIGQALAEEEGYIFIDGDDLHPSANIEKMHAGIPLTDEDRWGWLQNIAARASELNAQNTTVVIACSALKEIYRDVLRRGINAILFFYLKGSFEQIHGFLALRKKHFMPIDLLKSQFDSLQEPAANEQDCFTVPITSPEQELKEMKDQLALRSF